MEFFDRSVDDAMKDQAFIKDFVTFLSMYCIYAAPKEEMMKEVESAQLALYFEDKEKEENNEFPSFLEYQTSSDLAWQSWQYVNCYEDWMKKKGDNGKYRYVFIPKFTGDKHNRCQPSAGSEGMLLYNKMLVWFTQFKAHDGFTKNVRTLMNKEAKARQLLPDWTVADAPKKTVSRSSDSDDEMDDEDIPEVEDVGEADAFLFGDRITRNMSRTSCHQDDGDQVSSDDESNDD